ncbi:MAG: hypothetical protein GY861_16800 [bacterium]|nr:hypothetical protein [bacterium]
MNDNDTTLLEEAYTKMYTEDVEQDFWNHFIQNADVSDESVSNSIKVANFETFVPKQVVRDFLQEARININEIKGYMEDVDDILYEIIAKVAFSSRDDGGNTPLSIELNNFYIREEGDYVKFQGKIVVEYEHMDAPERDWDFERKYRMENPR